MPGWNERGDVARSAMSQRITQMAGKRVHAFANLGLRPMQERIHRGQIVPPGSHGFNARKEQRDQFQAAGNRALRSVAVESEREARTAESLRDWTVGRRFRSRANDLSGRLMCRRRRIKECSDSDPAKVLARGRILVRCRIGASLDSAYFEFPDTLC